MVSVDGVFLFRRRASHFDSSFRSISIISIYFDHFRSISIHFDSGIEIAKTFRSRAGHFDLFRYKIKIAKKSQSGILHAIHMVSCVPAIRDSRTFLARQQHTPAETHSRTLLQIHFSKNEPFSPSISDIRATHRATILKSLKKKYQKIGGKLMRI
jgi:hypothetical protein